MKNYFKSFLLITTIMFSFFYTDRVMNLINKKDPIMIKLNEIKDNYHLEPVNAITTEKTIIPGLTGRELNVEESYEAMKKDKLFREEKLVFNTLYPIDTVEDNKDKYIIKGNTKENRLSLLLKIDSDDYLEKIQNYNNLTLFLNSDIITSDNIKK